MAKIQKLNSVASVDEAKVEEKVETLQEQKERLEKEIAEYKEKVDAIESQEELDALEKDILAEYEKYDEYLKDVRYALPKDCEFEGKTYTRSDVAGKIIYFISKIEQKWQYIPGLYGICMLWKKANVEEIAYPVLDSTLRLLDQCTFRGMTEWRDILIVNEYMKAMHEQYTKDNNGTIALAQKHDAIIKRRDLIAPIKGELKD